LDVPAALEWTVSALLYPPVGIRIDPERVTHGNVYVTANTADGRLPRSVPLGEQPRRWGADAVHRSCSARKSIRIAPASGRRSGLARRFRTSPPGEGTQAPDLKALSKELLAW